MTNWDEAVCLLQGQRNVEGDELGFVAFPLLLTTFFRPSPFRPRLDDILDHLLNVKEVKVESESTNHTSVDPKH